MLGGFLFYGKYKIFLPQSRERSRGYAEEICKSFFATRKGDEGENLGSPFLSPADGADCAEENNVLRCLRILRAICLRRLTTYRLTGNSINC